MCCMLHACVLRASVAVRAMHRCWTRTTYPVCLRCRQQCEAADVEMARLAGQLEAAKAANAAASGEARQADAAAYAQLEAVLSKHVQVGQLGTRA